MIQTKYTLLGICLSLLWLIFPVLAQDTSDNAVNEIAQKMYCPVCENIPLDECQTATCIEWKEEIRNQLAQGESEQQIINSFITRFGDNVVGTPQDPVLRAMTILFPIIAMLLAVIAGVFTFRRFGQYQKLKLEDEPTINQPSDKTDDGYRQRLEQDLQARR